MPSQERPQSFDRDPSVKKYEVITVERPDGSAFGFAPERGGIVTSIKLQGVELLYLDQETFDDGAKSVRGGIPILFPNAGPLTEGSGYTLKQHGFARTSSEWKYSATDDGFVEALQSDDLTREQFPYDCTTQLRGVFEDNGSVTLQQSVLNREAGKEMPVSMGLHPYFRVPNDQKRNIHFDFPGGEQVAARFDEWSNDTMVSIDNPKANDPDAMLRIMIPGLGTLVFDVSPEYQKIWVWSLPGKDFICIEPVMRDPNGLVDDPQMVKPNEVFTASMNIRLESAE